MDCDVLYKRNGRGAQVRATSWVFLLIPDKNRPGVFFIQPIRPGLRELPNIIIRGACKAVKDAERLYKKLIAAGSIDDPKSLFAKTIEQKISERFGHLIPIEVIFEDELFRRARGGEFQLRITDAREQRRQNKRLRAIQGHIRIPRPQREKPMMPEVALSTCKVDVPVVTTPPCVHEVPPSISTKPELPKPRRWILELLL